MQECPSVWFWNRYIGTILQDLSTNKNILKEKEFQEWNVHVSLYSNLKHEAKPTEMFYFKKIKQEKTLYY